MDHALPCKLDGFVTQQQNELVNITANLVSSVFKDVCKEPVMQSSPGSDDELRADISMSGFWQNQQRAFVDVKVFYPKPVPEVADEINEEHQEREIPSRHP